MTDLISRQALIDAMYHEAFEVDSELQKWDSGCWIRYKMFENVIDDVPSAQQEITLESAIGYLYSIGWMQEHDRIMAESAQPELIRCKDCEYGEQDEIGRWFCRSLGRQVGNQDGSGYCADAERREEDG